MAASLVTLIGMLALTAGSADREGAGAADVDDGQWHRPARDHASTRYSGLAQITAANVKQPRPAWSFATGVNARVYLAPRWL